MWLLRAAIIAPLLFLAPQPGCMFGLTCTLIGGWDGLHLDVNTAGGLPPDLYTLVVRAEGHELQATFELFADGSSLCEAPCQPSVDLGGGRSLVARVMVGATGGLVVIGVDGEGGPDHVEVDLLRQDALVASAIYEPEYRTHRPNGPGCAPELTQAEGTFDIPAF